MVIGTAVSLGCRQSIPSKEHASRAGARNTHIPADGRSEVVSLVGFGQQTQLIAGD